MPQLVLSCGVELLNLLNFKIGPLVSEFEFFNSNNGLFSEETVVSINAVFFDKFAIESFRIYSVDITDYVYQENIGRYIGDWESEEAFYLTEPYKPNAASFSILNVKKYFQTIFLENDILYIVIETIYERNILRAACRERV
mgnify:CR=1 FL=1